MWTGCGRMWQKAGRIWPKLKPALLFILAPKFGTKKRATMRNAIFGLWALLLMNFVA